MKIMQLVAAAMAVSLLSVGPARAQFVVSDPATEAETLATALETAANLEQTITMVAMLTSAYGVTGLLTSLNQKNQYPSTRDLDTEMFSPRMPMSTTARAITTDTDRAVVGGDAEADLLRSQITGSANSAGIAADNLETMDKRLTANAETSTQLSRSRNIMQATVTNGLLLKQIHDAMIQNVQATSLLTMTTAQAGLHEAEEAAAQRKEHQKTAVIFGAVP
ncbi:pilin minor subunit VirB5 [Agrobacterium rhizogenes]|uniref:Type IV secretion system protein VirB5 n=15 Tax=Rhizobium/Agrobacterium group TaxID=227290 RepID=VIRB5_AGRFC|nr:MULTISPECIES: pilin minor subunit VirB5 [Rhizobium/Agrobacterium group]P17795.1 RecName: Full=Protein virB5; Flags: Precursor [Agrobacterium fabrum str. C58]AAA91595.1 virB5 [Plasmid Ti]AYD05080.1 type IV secretion system protein [Neorhizobium sp. NCHU2750]KAA6481479.1 protein virB5 [Agrobacterium sp. ICMP 7243]KJF70781.1 type IV secretion system protein VirB5 [Agrobacterium arsenijevicii]OCJ08401.1 type IV secretion system protein VirB5 [Agrobacterium sp. B131/95]OCJ27187.1 type IV secre